MAKAESGRSLIMENPLCPTEELRLYPLGTGMLWTTCKLDAVKVLHSVGQQIWKTQWWPRDWKRSVFIPVPKKGNAKECPNYHTTALISHAFDCVDHNKCGKFFKKWEYQTTLPASWETCMQVKKQQLELDMDQQTDSKLRKEYIKTVYYHPAYLTYMQSTSWETLGWMKHKLESRLPGEISVTSDMQMTPPLWQKVKNWRASWWKWKRRVKKLA